MIMCIFKNSSFQKRNTQINRKKDKKYEGKKGNTDKESGRNKIK
jgi:hypothetical protein